MSYEPLKPFLTEKGLPFKNELDFMVEMKAIKYFPKSKEIVENCKANTQSYPLAILCENC